MLSQFFRLMSFTSLHGDVRQCLTQVHMFSVRQDACSQQLHDKHQSHAVLLLICQRKWPLLEMTQGRSYSHCYTDVEFLVLCCRHAFRPKIIRHQGRVSNGLIKSCTLVLVLWSRPRTSVLKEDLLIWARISSGYFPFRSQFDVADGANVVNGVLIKVAWWCVLTLCPRWPWPFI